MVQHHGKKAPSSAKIRLSSRILDVRGLFLALRAVRDKAQGESADVVRAQVLAVVRGAYEHAREVIRADFLADGDAARATREASAMVDVLISILYQFAGNTLYRQKKYDLKKRLTIVAVGGYGRGELFPYSDIDVLFLHDTQDWEKASKIAEFILYILWDLGMQVGQSVRTVEETIRWAQSDTTVLTSLLDMRQVCGNAELTALLTERYWHEAATEEHALAFVETKLRERDERHQRAGDSRYVLEPRMKEGKGGLRDLQTLYWLARYVYRIRHVRELVRMGVLSAAEYRAYQRSHSFLATVRVHMHLLADRAEERLTFDMQRAVAERMGYRDRGDAKAVERFMKSWFVTAKTVGDLTRVVCAVLEDERKHRRRQPQPSLMFNPWKLNGFVTIHGWLAIPHDGFFTEHPPRLIELFALAQQYELDIHPRTLRHVTRSLALIDRNLRENPEANALFMEILTSPRQPEVALRRMSEAGVLGRFIPDFGRVIGQMQFDMYHVYTVDEHTIFAIGLLGQIRAGEQAQLFPLASHLMQRLDEEALKVLYLAVFCHDIAKGRGGDHSVLGERVARKLARRMGLRDEAAEIAAWLVRHHLLFSHTAFKRDISEEKTIADFVARVQSPEQLRLLLILTVVDIRAVGPQVWNSWKGALLRELYFHAEEKMGAADDRDTAAIRTPIFALSVEGMPDWPRAEQEEYFALGNDAFIRGFDGATHQRVAALLAQAQEGDAPQIALSVVPDNRLQITEILLAAPDRKGLFALVAGALTQVGANIVTAKIFTLKNGLAVEQFFVQDLRGHAFDDSTRIATLRELLCELLASGGLEMPLPVPLAFALKYRAFTVHPRVVIENSASSHHTVIETSGHDQPGFLYSVTRALAEMDLSISTAHVLSYGERAVDVFYVKDRFGMKIASEAKLRQIRDRLTDVLAAMQEPDSPARPQNSDKPQSSYRPSQVKGAHYV